jgi:hypothetical protein
LCGTPEPGRKAVYDDVIRTIDAIVCGAVCERNRELLFGQVLTPRFDLVFVVADDSRGRTPRPWKNDIALPRSVFMYIESPSLVPAPPAAVRPSRYLPRRGGRLFVLAHLPPVRQVPDEIETG